MMRKMKITVAATLALLLVASCAMFQADPIGSSLVASKNTYESYMTQSAIAYKDGQITQAQLVEIRDVGRRFYDAYTLAEMAYLAKAEKDFVKFRAASEGALLELTRLATKYLVKK